MRLLPVAAGHAGVVPAPVGALCRRLGAVSAPLPVMTSAFIPCNLHSGLRLPMHRARDGATPPVGCREVGCAACGVWVASPHSRWGCASRITAATPPSTMWMGWAVGCAAWLARIPLSQRGHSCAACTWRLATYSPLQQHIWACVCIAMVTTGLERGTW